MLLQRNEALPTRTRRLIGGYTGGAVSASFDSGYVFINSRLRSGVPLSSNEQEVVDEIERVADAHRLPVAITVYRGISVPDPEYAIRPIDLSPGSLVTDPAPVSTTLDYSRARTFGTTVLKVTLPAGTPAIPVDQLTKGPNYRWGKASNEEEIILKPGTALRVVGESRDAQGRRVVEAELAPVPA